MHGVGQRVAEPPALARRHRRHEVAHVGPPPRREVGAEHEVVHQLHEVARRRRRVAPPARGAAAHGRAGQPELVGHPLAGRDTDLREQRVGGGVVGVADHPARERLLRRGQRQPAVLGALERRDEDEHLDRAVALQRARPPVEVPPVAVVADDEADRADPGRGVAVERGGERRARVDARGDRRARADRPQPHRRETAGSTDDECASPHHLTGHGGHGSGPQGRRPVRPAGPRAPRGRCRRPRRSSGGRSGSRPGCWTGC